MFIGERYTCAHYHAFSFAHHNRTGFSWWKKKLVATGIQKFGHPLECATTQLRAVTGGLGGGGGGKGGGYLHRARPFMRLSNHTLSSPKRIEYCLNLALFVLYEKKGEKATTFSIQP